MVTAKCEWEVSSEVQLNGAYARAATDRGGGGGGGVDNGIQFGVPWSSRSDDSLIKFHDGDDDQCLFVTILTARNRAAVRCFHIFYATAIVVEIKER